MQTIRRLLIDWFNNNKRDLPWRNRSHWYPVFLSEFLLQQTQVVQALPYYQKFLQRFPTVYELAGADEDQILQMWAGLGYYSRALNLLKAARHIVERFNGRFPESLKEALQLPGIGPYTAAAILSLSFNQPVAVVDGNVMRVLARLFALKQDIRLTSTKTKIKRVAQHLLPQNQAGLFNEALIELGALICKPNAPLCRQCPLQNHCRSFKQNLTHCIPFKSASRPKRKLFHLVLVIRNSANEFLIAQRKEKGLMAKMWEFPSLQVKQLPEARPEAIKEIMEQNRLTLLAKFKAVLPVIKHTYTHIVLQMLPVLLEGEPTGHLMDKNYRQINWQPVEQLDNLAMHNAHKKIVRHRQFQDWLQTC